MLRKDCGDDIDDINCAVDEKTIQVKFFVDLASTCSALTFERVFEGLDALQMLESQNVLKALSVKRRCKHDVAWLLKFIETMSHVVPSTKIICKKSSDLLRSNTQCKQKEEKKATSAPFPCFFFLHFGSSDSTC